MNFKWKYFLWFLVLLFIELSIALYVKDKWIRPYFGDVLVVILIYTFIRAFFNLKTIQAILIVLVFSFSIEISQYFHLIRLLKLEDFQVAHWVLGSSFNWWDLVAYILGLLVVYAVERFRRFKD